MTHKNDAHNAQDKVYAKNTNIWISNTLRVSEEEGMYPSNDEILLNAAIDSLVLGA